MLSIEFIASILIAVFIMSLTGVASAGTLVTDAPASNPIASYASDNVNSSSGT
jgi:hypothetical protein